MIVGAEADPAGGDEPDGVFEVGLGADVGEEVAQAPLAEEVDVQRQRAAEPGDADDLAAGADRVDGLQQRLVPGQPLLRAAAGALEHHVRAVAAGQVADRRDDVAVVRR